MIHGLPFIFYEDDECESCIDGKQKRMLFLNEHLWRTETPLQLVHAYACGPTGTASLSARNVEECY